MALTVGTIKKTYPVHLDIDGTCVEVGTVDVEIPLEIRTADGRDA